MVMKDLPFKENGNKKTVLQVIKETNMDWNNRQDIPIKSSGKLLLNSLLQRDAAKRDWNILQKNNWLQ